MKKSLTSGVGVAAVLMMVFGSGTAGAINEYVGMTYEKAAESITAQGRTVVVTTREGSYLPTEQCMVVGSRFGSGKTLLDLNCNDYSALNGHPGNSVATPEGKKAMLQKDRAARMSKDYENSLAAGKTPVCLRDEGSATWCIDVCTQSKACSAELNEALGL